MVAVADAPGAMVVGATTGRGTFKVNVDPVTTIGAVPLFEA
jgi:hypothetical protein